MSARTIDRRQELAKTLALGVQEGAFTIESVLFDAANGEDGHVMPPLTDVQVAAIVAILSSEQIKGLTDQARSRILNHALRNKLGD